ncbi:hypothetical protein HPB47_024047 [Ixodes persulcatus]|uniref:Uncharacterized protein n=1 Tax=Ixodes persulcatus TaxID=34615 RepID=A0AC60Q7W9_IXOPE|nr:hypothetical protein HPB47_024047 [Ixodes persulcatus]
MVDVDAENRKQNRTKCIKHNKSVTATGPGGSSHSFAPPRGANKVALIATNGTERPASDKGSSLQRPHREDATSRAALAAPANPRAKRERSAHFRPFTRAEATRET